MLKESRLILPRRMCGACGSDRIWTDFRGEVHCMQCMPPQLLVRKLKDEKRRRIAETRAVDFEVQRAIEDEARDGAFIPKHW